jgi:hypothetical protein
MRDPHPPSGYALAHPLPQCGRGAVVALVHWVLTPLLIIPCIGFYGWRCCDWATVFTISRNWRRISWSEIA